MVADVILGVGVGAAVPFPPLVLSVFVVRGSPVMAGFDAVILIVLVGVVVAGDILVAGVGDVIPFPPLVVLVGVVPCCPLVVLVGVPWGVGIDVLVDGPSLTTSL